MNENLKQTMLKAEEMPEMEKADSGELTDEQLDAVAGGSSRQVKSKGILQRKLYVDK